MNIKKILLQILHLTGIFIFIFILTRTDLERLINIFMSIDIYGFIFTCLLIPLLELPRALRFKRLLKIQGIRMDMRLLILSYQSSIFFGNISPARAGDFYKIRYLPVKKITGTMLVMADRGFDFLLLLYSGFFCYGLFVHSTVYMYIASLLPFITILLFYFLKRYSKNDNLIRRTLIRTNLHRLLTKWDFTDVLYLSLFSLAATLLFFFFNYSIINLTLGYGVDISDIILLVSIVSLSNIIPITISGIGTREAFSLFVFSKYGLGEAQSIAYGTMSFFLIMIIASMYSFIVWLYTEKYFN